MEESCLVEAAQALEAQREQLARLQSGRHPRAGRMQIPLAAAAKVQVGLQIICEFE